MYPPPCPHLLGIFVDLVIGDDDDDRQEHAERRRGPFGRNRKRRSQQRQGEHRGDLHHAMVEIGYACRSEEHTSELQSLMRISYASFCLKKKNTTHLTSQSLFTVIH